MRHFNVIIAALIFFSCSDNSQKNSERVDYKVICDEFDQYAIDQRNLLDQIRKEYKTDKLFIARFNQEQMNWIQYQDSRLRSLYSKDWDTFYRKNYGKSIFNGCKCKELIRMSQIRNQELRTYLDGPDNSQSECPIQGHK